MNTISKTAAKKLGFVSLTQPYIAKEMKLLERTVDSLARRGRKHVLVEITKRPMQVEVWVEQSSFKKT